MRAEVVVVVVVKLLDVPADESRLLNRLDVEESAADTGFLSLFACVTRNPATAIDGMM